MIALSPGVAGRLAELGDGETRLIAIQGRRRMRCRALHFMDRGFARRFLIMDELTEELHRSERAAYEKLIRMMSHEVNNTAGAVGSLLQSCLAYAGQIDEADRDDFANALGVAIGEDGVVGIRGGKEPGRPFLVIRDDGGGIPPEAREHLFTPFYTSKENGQGIGLTMTQEILLGHGFDFSLESDEGGRTSFTILF